LTKTTLTATNDRQTDQQLAGNIKPWGDNKLIKLTENKTHSDE